MPVLSKPVLPKTALQKPVPPRKLIALALTLWPFAGLAQPLNIDDVARAASIEKLVSNAAILAAFEQRCTDASDARTAALKSQINTYAAVGEYKVGRDEFRRQVIDELKRNQRTMDGLAPGAWCRDVALQLQNLGIAIR